MTNGDGDEPPFAEIDAILATWRQGDCVRGEQWFAHRFDASAPLTDDARAAAEEGSDLVEVAVRGLVVLTQTCDVVRACGERPFVEVAPLVEVDASVLHDIQRGRRPLYAAIPGVADDQLVADLDRTMTVEKAIVARWARIEGCRTDRDVRQLAQSLARKRARFAFPDDLAWFAKKLQSRLVDKHERASDEGRALRALREIRVRAAPSWDAGKVELFFWFVRDDSQPDFEGRGWNEHLAAWMTLIPPSGRFEQVDAIVATLDDMTARDYVESDPLDLDHLSSPKRVGGA